ncbi:hypothetical protein AOQ84DRAFT_42250 [Glonium stellatum]|uniref:Glycine cleavage system H protein n=1 Tax=Glonium stellatum TaxID=574774 RepID=A0A8E2JYZ3_9PEZI|nr:hypothetical protein AOQ84DRAFT_42250 [Glonium stellatum]
MAARLWAARVMRQFPSTISRRSCPQFQSRSGQWQSTHVQRPRLFSVSATVQEKKYTEDHEWIELSEDGKTCTLGISTYAANALGDVVFIELPQIKMEVSAGDAIGAVESVKSASDILTPVGGIVTDINSVLEEKPGTINQDPEGDAWIAKLEIKEEPTGKLMSAEEYRQFTED